MGKKTKDKPTKAMTKVEEEAYRQAYDAGRKAAKKAYDAEKKAAKKEARIAEKKAAKEAKKAAREARTSQAQDSVAKRNLLRR